ncbi:MAG TPA: copper-binding protein [Opitutus sp.]|nr:copper-binding protein [Opitutus sp.]
MKRKLLSLISALSLLPLALVAGENAKNCGCDCCKGKDVCCCHAADAAAATADKAERHPLKGVIVDVRPAQFALLVKHEDIPGVMRAMTMLFKVDAATLADAKKGQAITGQLVQRDDEFWLEDVKPAK